MSGPTRPPDPGAPRQPWSPDTSPRGITCPACGLTNEVGARVCRNCGLPIASAEDPLRGVSAGRVEMPSAQRSGLSATVGLALVVGLLLVAGTLAVSGGGILESGGRLGVPVETPDDGSAVGAAATSGPQVPGTSIAPATEATIDPASIGHEFDFTCGPGVIKDANSAKWRLEQFLGGATDEFDRVRFKVRRRSGKADPGTTVSMEWVTPREARERFGLRGVQGQRAILVTFDGPVNLEKNQRLDSLFLDGQGVEALRTVDSFVDEDGVTRAVIGVRGDGCARLDAPFWRKKNKKKRAEIVFQIETQSEATAQIR